MTTKIPTTGQHAESKSLECSALNWLSIFHDSFKDQEIYVLEGQKDCKDKDAG